MPDAVGGSRPQSPLWQLAAVAIFSLPGHRAKSRDIRAALQNRFPYFRNNANELAESLKHALSSRHLFVNQPTEPYDGQKRGKGGYWALDVFTNPLGTRPRTGKRMNSQRSGESDSALVNTPEHSNAERSMQY
ncbi:hypothetical protein CYLTODRAFT_418945 [Cylindrobasidium torrendii FP15055 ss-10]|uniref:Fork-head domain-containing protein n=1 Tax=Cylindrobasidium torrendii FP15055 ss-10 TaxID=1314674 RepID=A0A0D7BL33_9AGAR|nr:hypothetical protein CYLTODRAFT_418945 [Cylindrobasidium torrendii FP15055 ss-10]